MSFQGTGKRVVVGLEGGSSWLAPPLKEVPRLGIGLRYGKASWTARPLSLEAPLESESSHLPVTV